MRTVTRGPINRNRRTRTAGRTTKSAKPSSSIAKWLRLSARLFLAAFMLAVVWVVYIQLRVQSPPSLSLPDRADAGIVLGASLRKDMPSPGLKERLDHALRLYRDKKFSQFIVSGGLDHNGSKLTEAEGMRNYLIQQGVPERNICIEPKATSTYENLLFSKQIMDKQGFSTAIVITHDFHGSRSLDIARTVGISNPIVSTTGSEALFLPYHEARETLAYTKWELTKLQLVTGLLKSK